MVLGIGVLLIIIIAATTSGSKNPNVSSTATTVASPAVAAAGPPTTIKAPPPATIKAPPPTTTKAPPPTAAAASGLKTTFGDGDWIPGKTIAAGTYITQGESGCYWERDSDTSGSGNGTLANDNAVGQSIVTILPTDAEFQSQGCGTWHPLPTSGPQVTTFGDGEYAIGINIAPGTYSAPGGSNCYWEADSDFTQSGNSIVANDNPVGGVVVSIGGSGEVLFIANGCGTWTMQ